MDAKEFTRSIAMNYLPQQDYLGWFEELYQQAGGDPNLIHWGALRVTPVYQEWLHRNNPQGQKKKAVIVGCGFGDDAEITAQFGFDTTAFDIAPIAVQWCKNRFPNASVHYCAADLFNPPASWQNAFDLVMEAYTLQNFPEDMRRTALENLARMTAPSGTLLIIAKGRGDDEPLDKIPWPLSRRELGGLRSFGLEEVEFEDVDRPDDPNGRIFFAVYRKQP
ncbi:MAG: class I SAM-dependent methyltransferase [Candidatus Hinthialibacter sp.]